MSELPVPTARLVVRRFAAYRADPEVARYRGGTSTPWRWTAN
jgi:hypothetical protein